jgi:hypothetical protein
VQWWRLRHVANGIAQTPSPAMVKALLINGAVDTRAGGPIPNMEQGWGRVNLMNIFHPAIPAIYLDQEILLRPDSPPVTFQIDVVDPTRPLKITLVWTDAAGVVNTGVPGNPALVNALGLRVAQNSHAWFGNNFAGGWSQTGGVQDAIQAVQPGRIVNNVQNVFIQGPNGRYEVRISPELIAGDCMNVTGAASSDFRQDFALVIQNARLAPGSSPTVTLVVEDGEPEEIAAAHLVFLPLLATGGRLFTPPPMADVGGEETAIADALALPSGDSLSRRAIILAGNQLGAISDQALGRLHKEQTVHTVATGIEVAAARLEAAAQAGWGAFWHVFQPARVALLYDAILAQESGMEGVRYAAGVLEQVAQVERFPVVASDHKLFFLVHWDRPGAAIAVNLLRPDGTAIDPDHARRSSLVDYQATALGAAYAVTQPSSRSGAWEGEWSVGLQAPAGAAATNFTVSLLVDSSLRLQLAWDKLSYTGGETMRLSAQVVDANHVLTQGLRLLVRTETADQGATAVHEDEAAISFALGNGDQPDGYDTPHAATVRMHLQAGAAGVHDHTIGVEGTTASGAPFVRTRLVSRCVGSAPAAALAAMPPAIAETAEARGTPTTAGKLTELCYGGDGAFRGFRLQTATDDITYVPARAQLLSQVLIDALARQLRVAVVLEPEDGSALEVRLLPP